MDEDEKKRLATLTKIIRALGEIAGDEDVKNVIISAGAFYNVNLIVVDEG